MLAVEHRCLQRYAIETIPARVYEGCCTWFTILVLSARKWLPCIWEPFFVQFHRPVVAPNDRRKTTSASLLLTHFSRRIQVIDIQKITHFCLLQFDRSLSCNQLSINNFHSTHRTASSTQRRLFANQPHIGTPYGHTERPTSCAKGRYRAMAHRNHPHSARKRHPSAAV